MPRFADLRQRESCVWPGEMRKYLDEWIPQWTGKDGDAYAHTLTAGLGDWVPPIYVPAASADTVTEISGTAAVPLTRGGGVTVAGREGTRIVLEVGSGRYRFRAAR